MSEKATCALVFANGKKSEEIVEAINKSSDMMKHNVSLWLWIRGQYDNGSLSGENWKIAFELQKSGWQVRNEIAFSCKVSDPAPENRLKRGYENLMHLVRSSDYYYDRTMGSGYKDSLSKNKGGLLVTRSGLVGLRYARQIESSQLLTSEEKEAAIAALKDVGLQLSSGKISDFRMILRGARKISKSIAEKVDKSGFYIRTTKSHSLPMDDFWTAFSGDTNSSIPTGVLLSVLRLSCPMDDVVLDLFPSTVVAKTVIGAGRVYVARGIDVYDVIKPEPGLFNVEEEKYEESCVENKFDTV
jgi:site-specific DNA-methyltransferase (adenine-specific)